MKRIPAPLATWPIETISLCPSRGDTPHGVHLRGTMHKAEAFSARMSDIAQEGDVLAAQRAEIERLRAQVARWKRAAKWYRRALHFALSLRLRSVRDALAAARAFGEPKKRRALRGTESGERQG